MMQIVLTVADHDRNGFVELASWRGLCEIHARRLLERIDSLVSDESEPDDETTPFSFVLDLKTDDDGTIVDTTSRSLPMQIAMRLAPEQVQSWLIARPDPDSRSFYAVPSLPVDALDAFCG